MSRGRPPSTEPYKTWSVNVPAALAGRIEFIFFDRIYNKPSYGERGKLVVRLLEEWLNSEEGKRRESEARTLNATPGAF